MKHRKRKRVRNIIMVSIIAIGLVNVFNKVAEHVEDKRYAYKKMLKEKESKNKTTSSSSSNSGTKNTYSSGNSSYNRTYSSSNKVGKNLFNKIEGAESNLPYAGMDTAYLSNTRLGKPHEIIKPSSPEYFNFGEQYDAKWYFEDATYDYRCTAKVFTLDSGNEIVKEFSIYADPKGTYKYGKLYSDQKYYTRKDGVITCFKHEFRNDFKTQR